MKNWQQKGNRKWNMRLESLLPCFENLQKESCDHLPSTICLLWSIINIIWGRGGICNLRYSCLVTLYIPQTYSILVPCLGLFYLFSYLISTEIIIYADNTFLTQMLMRKTINSLSVNVQYNTYDEIFVNLLKL